jgi:hypothetical protein
LAMLLRAEAAWVSRGHRLPVGTSLAVIARKPVVEKIPQRRRYSQISAAVAYHVANNVQARDNCKGATLICFSKKAQQFISDQCVEST